MTKDGFASFVTDLCSYTVHKLPAKETLQVWYRDCSRIPDEALEWIKSTQLRETDGFPAKNFPKWIWAQFNLWLEANPEKKAHDKKGCDQCHEGWVTVSKYDGRVKYRGDLLFRCANCNGGPGAVPAKTRLQLLEEGYCRPVSSIVRSYHKPFSDPPLDETGLRIWEPPVRFGPEAPVPEDGPQQITAEDLPF